MTRTTNARTAGITFIVYFAAVMAQVAGARDPHLRIILTLIGQFSAFVLGVTLYALTRDYDRDPARLGLGVLASALMVVALPLQLASVVQGRVVGITSLPIVFFELPLGVWLIAKGVPVPSHDAEAVRVL